MRDDSFMQEAATIICGSHATFHEHSQSRLEKYHGSWTPEQIARGMAGRPYDVVEDFTSNLLTTVGAGDFWKALEGASFTAFSNANAFLGVGDSSTAATAADTDLNASTNKLRVAMDSTFPTRSTNQSVFQSTFGTSQANFAWNEWGVFNASSGGDMLNHKVVSLGTKVNTATWQFNTTLSLS